MDLISYPLSLEGTRSAPVAGILASSATTPSLGRRASYSCGTAPDLDRLPLSDLASEPWVTTAAFTVNVRQASSSGLVTNKLVTFYTMI